MCFPVGEWCEAKTGEKHVFLEKMRVEKCQNLQRESPQSQPEK